MAPRSSARAGLRFCALVYLVTRVPVVAAVALYLARNPRWSVQRLLLHKDGWWYTWIAHFGYSSSLRPHTDPPTDYHHTFSEWAFYPGYPLTIRAVHVLGLAYLPSAYVVVGVFGLLAVWAMYALGEAFGGPVVARASAALFAFWPGSAVMTLPYSEALFVTAAALSLLLLHRERWILAGLVGAVATATRPTGLAVIVACTAVAAVRLVRHRTWRPLVAPGLAATGVVAFVLYGWLRSGDPLIWRHAEYLWQQRLDFSQETLQQAIRVFGDPAAALRTAIGQTQLADSLLDVLGLAALVTMVVAAVALRRRLTAPMVAYALVVVGLIVAYSAVAPRPRTVLTVLPGFVWVAAWLPPRAVVVVSVIGFVGLGVVTYLWLGMVTP